MHVAAEAAPRCAFLSTREFQRRISLLGNVLVDCQRSLVLLGVLMYQEYEVRGPSRRAISVTGHLKFKGCSDFYVLSKFSFYFRTAGAAPVQCSLSTSCRPSGSPGRCRPVPLPPSLGPGACCTPFLWPSATSTRGRRKPKQSLSREFFFNRLLKLCFNAQLPKGNAPKV